MRHADRHKRHLDKLRAPSQRWFMILFGISGCGVVLATGLLMFDGWMDALAIYGVSGLVLALLLSRLAGQQAATPANFPADSASALGPDAIAKRWRLVWFNHPHAAARLDVAVAPTVLAKAPSRDR